jgi:hypothetical protein
VAGVVNEHGATEALVGWVGNESRGVAVGGSLKHGHGIDIGSGPSIQQEAARRRKIEGSSASGL